MATRERAFSATPADHFPRSAAAASTMAGYISTGQYVWGLRRVLDGITARAAAGPHGDGEGDSVVAEEVDLSNRRARLGPAVRPHFRSRRCFVLLPRDMNVVVVRESTWHATAATGRSNV
jgi:hypothetical protein